LFKKVVNYDIITLAARGACSGNTISFLNAEGPSAVDLVTDFGIDIVWHPSLGLELGEPVKQMIRDIASGKEPLDIFVFEGSVIQGAEGTGRFNMFAERPMMDWLREIAPRAQIVVALGGGACWGGIPATAPNLTDSIGLQFMGYCQHLNTVSNWGLSYVRSSVD